MEPNIEFAIQQLRDNRLMETDEQLSIYEQVLDQIGNDEDVTHIPALCQAFDDNTEHREVMVGLVHIIEGYADFSSRKEELSYFLQGAPAMLPHAADWLRTMLVRILNHDKSRELFGELLANSEASIKELIRVALQKISSEDPNIFQTKVAEVSQLA